MNTDTTPTRLDPVEQQKTIDLLTQENEYLKARIELLLAQIYGRKSEKFNTELIRDQMNFMGDFEEEEPSDDSEEEAPSSIPISAHKRKRVGRKPIPDALPRIEVIHDIPEDQKQCACGSSLSRIGEETSEQLDYVPAKLQVLRHIRPKYACKSCEGLETEGGTVKILPPPKTILPKCIVSAALLAHLIVAKFVDALPFYRQEKQFFRLGYEISRTNMANWIIQLGFLLEELIDLLREEALSGALIHLDETTLQVLKEEGRPPTSKSYMWVIRGGPPERPAVYFHYSPSRSSETARSLLQSYCGVVQTDGYGGYDFINHSPNMEHASCWAHARRKFMEVLKATGVDRKKMSKQGHAGQALRFIGDLYGIEHRAKDLQLTPDQRRELRQKESKPILEQFHQWLISIESKIPPRGLLGKAVAYTLNRWDQLTLYLNHGFVPMDNNLAENAIRPFVVGRKNFLFCDTEAGATAMARLYSLVETAKANQLNPFDYLKALFERLPYAESKDQLKSLLPQYFKSTDWN